MTIIDAMTDPRVWGATFAGDSWRPWRALLAAAFALPLDAEALALYRRCTGRQDPPSRPAREILVQAGRRSGKSIASALVACFLAAFGTYRVAPGETPVVLVCAVSKEQAAVVFGYVVGLLESSALTAGQVAKRTAESVTLANGVRIEVRSSHFRVVRGVSLAAAIVDELAFLRSEDSATPDVELWRALKPAASTIPGAVLVGISSPWAARGLLHRKHRRHFGKDVGGVLFWCAPTATMNPTIDRAIIEEAHEDDPVAARTEWEAAFREDIVPFLSEAQLEAVTVPGRGDLPRVAAADYVGFIDASGGSQDSFTAAVAHAEQRDGERVVVVDAVRERRSPFDPSDVVAEYAALLGAYGLARATADRYAGAWVTEAFAKREVHVAQNAEPKAALYAAFLPLVTGRRVELPDHRRLRAQLLALERRCAPSGRELIAEPPGGKDDLANAVAGAAVLAAASSPGFVVAVRKRGAAEPDVPEEWDYSADPWAGGGDPLEDVGARMRREFPPQPF